MLILILFSSFNTVEFSAFIEIKRYFLFTHFKLDFVSPEVCTFNKLQFFHLPFRIVIGNYF